MPVETVSQAHPLKETLIAGDRNLYQLTVIGPVT